MILRVGYDDAAAVGVEVLRIAGDARIETGEQERRLELRAEGFDFERRGLGGKGALEPPRGCLAKWPPRASIRGDGFVKAEPGMVFEKLDKALSDSSGRPEDGDGDFLGGGGDGFIALAAGKEIGCTYESALLQDS